MTSFKKLARDELLGHYRLLAWLGHGGMADVFLARVAGRTGADQLVAIKRMLPILSRDRAFVAMFLNEGRIATQLAHPNVCQVYELGEADGTLFLAMEFLRGLPWSDIVPAIPDQPQARLIRFVTGVIAQACEGLHHAHTAVDGNGQLQPIVHRDVSPTNLFVTTDGVVKLLDFGVSKILAGAAETVSGLRKGKLPYMAPEQLQGKPVDIRADVFSLAVVAWEAFAGRALFDGKSEYDVMTAVAQTQIPPLPGQGRVIESIDAVLRRGLARDRAQRHGSIRGFADDLRMAIAQLGEPMTAYELHAQLAIWLGPSLAGQSRDLAAVVDPGRPAIELTDEHTLLHQGAPTAGVRLREVSLVVGSERHEATEMTTIDHVAGLRPAATTLIDAPIVEPLGLEVSELPTEPPTELPTEPPIGRPFELPTEPPTEPPTLRSGPAGDDEPAALGPTAQFVASRPAAFALAAGAPVALHPVPSPPPSVPGMGPRSRWIVQVVALLVAVAIGAVLTLVLSATTCR